MIVIEKDSELVINLQKKFKNKLTIINDDILRINEKSLFNEKVIVFGNLPYNISTKILSSFIKIQDLKMKYKKFIFIFQKEVADRILANENTKNYGRLSILTSWKMDKLKLLDIDPKFFYPKPKVWSTLISLTPKSDYQKLKNSNDLENITNVFFKQRRKMIKKPMKQLFKDYETISKKLDLDLNLRPQNISVNKYLEICKSYEILN